MKENSRYKLDDHLFRSKDLYAQSKYDMTVVWLRGWMKAGMRLVNIGCGSGEFNHQAAALGFQVTGCEPERGAFDIASQTRPTENCEVLHCGLFDLQSAAGSFDALVMHDVLEHIEDEGLAVEAMGALLRTGGRAVVSVPAMNWLFGHHDVQLGHYRRYSMKTLLPLFDGRFKVRQARYFGFAFIPITFLFSKMLKKAYPTGEASQGILHRLMAGVCAVETRISPPLGTSIVVELEKN